MLASSNKKVKLQRKKLTEFPYETLKNYPSLRSLSLRTNEIRIIPSKELFTLGNAWKITLTKLDMSRNLLEEIPREISSLLSLKTLNLEFNHLKELPKDIGKLVKLRKFLLSNNVLKELPVEMKELVDLEYLNVCNNQLGKLPSCLGALPKLKNVDYFCNPLVYPPSAVLKLGWEETRPYLQAPLKYIGKNQRRYYKEGTSPFNLAKDAFEMNSVIAEVISNLKKCLANPASRKDFANFLQKEFSLENLLFVEDIETLHSQEHLLADEDYQTEAFQIFLKYIKSSDVNLPHEIQGQILRLFAQCDLSEQSSFNTSAKVVYPPRADIKEVFDKAQNNLMQLLALDSYKRYSSATAESSSF